MTGDMKKTWALRAFLFCILFMVALFAVGLIDVIYDHASVAIGLPHQPAIIEGMILVYVLWKMLWGWLSERVWIGRLPRENR